LPFLIYNTQVIKLLKNLFFALLVSIGLFLSVDYAIQWYTKHGVTVQVPNLVGKSKSEAFKLINEAKLIPILQDSVYSDSFPKLSITDQDPESSRVVKEGRKIYLTINSLPKPKVRMPKLTDKSINLAKAILINTGLQLGTVKEQYSLLGSGFVIQQYLDSDSIASGKLVEKGTKIDLKISKYITVDSVYIRGVDTSKVIGWEFRQGYMNEKERNREEDIYEERAKDTSSID
jgi:beta-lactam-binding protein with PASTA domain